jgi:hypothetical protein
MKQLYQSKHNSSAATDGEKVVVSEVGWLSFTIYDIAVTKSQDQAGEINLCYAGRHSTFNSTACIYENAAAVGSKEKSEYLGGNSYFFSMKSEGRVILWSAVADNGDGRYFVKIRVDDPGEYVIKVYRDQVQGCATASCYVPASECPTFLSEEELKHCGQTNICMREVANMTMRIESSEEWPLWKVASTLTTAPTQLSEGSRPHVRGMPPACPADEIGIVAGRWVSPRVLTSSEYNFTEGHIFGELDWPYVWMPYDCYIPAMPQACRRDCIGKYKLAFSGLSRERTNSFDIEDFAGRRANYRKIQEALILGDNFYFPLYHQQIKDRVGWNLPDYYLNDSIAVTLYDLNDYKLCNLTDSAKSDSKFKPLAFMANEEIYWFSTSAYKSRWTSLSGYFHKNLVSFCANDNVTFVYKTSVPVSVQNRAQSWEKFLQATRQSAKIAISYGMRVVDAFMLSMPMLHEKSVFPDGVHLYSATQLQGNYVSKTATLMFLRLLCFDCAP